MVIEVSKAPWPVSILFNSRRLFFDNIETRGAAAVGPQKRGSNSAEWSIRSRRRAARTESPKLQLLLRKGWWDADGRICSQGKSFNSWNPGAVMRSALSAGWNYRHSVKETYVGNLRSFSVKGACTCVRVCVCMTLRAVRGGGGNLENFKCGGFRGGSNEESRRWITENDLLSVLFAKALRKYCASEENLPRRERIPATVASFE